MVDPIMLLSIAMGKVRILKGDRKGPKMVSEEKVPVSSSKSWRKQRMRETVTGGLNLESKV
jgi:hypothetical protein